MTETTTRPADAPLLLDCHQAAALLGVSLRKFRDLTKQDGFPAGRALGPRSTRWSRGELEAFAACLPTVRRDEPAHLTEARKARNEGKVPAPAAHAPFPAPAAPPQAAKAWDEIR